MSQSLAPETTPSLKPSPITLDDVRTWAKGLEGGAPWKVTQERVDENVEWTFSAPAGPLGKTTPISGVLTSRDQFEEAMTLLRARFVEPQIDYKIIDVFVQPSEMNKPSERHLTKAVVEYTGSATLKKNGQGWINYCAYVLQFDNTTKKIVKSKGYMDSAAINKAFED